VILLKVIMDTVEVKIESVKSQVGSFGRDLSEMRGVNSRIAP
jgi:hypothetical protein